LSYCCLELGVGLLLFAGFLALDEPGKPRAAFAGFALLGSTAFFYYLWHVHLMAGLEVVAGFDRTTDGLAKTWLGALVPLVVLAGPCVWYRKYKSVHPDGWTRYV
jgi:peptidoglycan/LPS O-acetylase OafA/YrhL